MPTDTQPAPIPHIEDPNAPIVYADFSLGGGRMAGDNITIAFAAKVLDHTQNPPTSHTKTVLRLVMPIATMAGTADFIRQLLASLEAGADAPAANTTIN